MRLLASYAMRGKAQAIIAISSLALLALLMPFLGLLNTGLIALVTLSQGYKEGFKILLASAIAVGVLSGLILGQPFAVLIMTIPMWFMVWLFVSFMGFSGSLSKMVVAVLAMSGFIILSIQISLDDPMMYWSEVLTPLVASFEQQGLLKEEQLSGLVEQMATWMTAIIAVGFFLQVILSVLLGSWWYAYLYKPGKFAVEFQQLRLPCWLSVMAVALVAFSQLLEGDEAHLVQYFALLLLSAFLFSGLALFHYLMKNVQGNTIWIVSLYLLLFLFPITIAFALASAGIVDAWINLRMRIQYSKKD